jgi:hypothetical protein
MELSLCSSSIRQNCAQSGGWFGASASQQPLERKNQMKKQALHLVSDQFRH